MMIATRSAFLPRLILTGLVALALAGCSMGGGGLAPGLVARMDSPGARLDRVEALNLINQFRIAGGGTALLADAALDAKAQSLATQFARSGAAPKKPEGTVAMRTSAGYYDFAETFSGWRASPADAGILQDRAATRAGLSAVYDPNSAYGVYWVLILED